MSDPYVFVLRPSKHKRRTYRHMILATDDTGTRPKVLKYNISASITFVAIIFMLLGGFVGLVIFEGKRDQIYEQTISEKNREISELTSENNTMSTEIASLNNKIEILSNTVTTKTQSEAELAETLEAQSVPSEFPLTGSASFKENTGEIPECVFTASEGTTVVATAAGVVEDILEDDVFGNVVVIDHNNGYKTFYKNKGDSMVKKGDSVSPGTTLYIIGNGNSDMCYQISEDGIFINPLDILQING